MRTSTSLVSNLNEYEVSESQKGGAVANPQPREHHDLGCSAGRQADESSGANRMRIIYHFLSRAFGQQVSISQVVDFDVLDIVAVGNIHIGLHLIVAWFIGLRARRSDRGHINMLGSLSRL